MPRPATPGRVALEAVASSVSAVIPWRPIAGQAGRVWTEENSGRTASGTLLAANEETARVRRSDGKLVSVALARLSTEDREYVHSALRILPQIATRPVAGADQPSTSTPNNARSGIDVIGQLHNWLGIARGSEPAALRLWQAVSADDARPNASEANAKLPSNLVYVRFSRPFLNGYVARQVDRQHAVSETILGYYVTGASRVRGNVELVLLPSNEGGLAELRFRGTSAFDTMAHAGRVRVLTRGVTDFSTRKSLRLGEKGLVMSPTSTKATTRSTISGIETDLPRLRGRIATRIATSRAEESRSESQAITTQRTAARISRRFDQTVEQQFRNGEHKAAEGIARFRELGELSGYGLEISTTTDMLELVVLGPVTDEPLLASVPTALAEIPDIEVQIHATLVNRLLNDGEFRSRLKPVLDLLTASQSWAMTSLVSFPAIPGEGRYDARWSDDRTWFTLCWNSAGR